MDSPVIMEDYQMRKKNINIIWALFSPLPIIVYMKEYKQMEACQSNDQWSTSDHLILPLYWDIVV